MIDKSKPWLTQLKSIEHDLIKEALTQCNGNQSETSRVLGIDYSTLQKRVSKNKEFKDIVSNKTIKVKKEPSPNEIIGLFLSGYSIDEIIVKVGMIKHKVMDILSEKLTHDICNNINTNNHNMRSEKMMNTEQILENNRLILAEIAEKVRENKGHELSDEHLVYAKILFSNGFMTKKGEITAEGKEALYH